MKWFSSSSLFWDAAEQVEKNLARPADVLVRHRVRWHLLVKDPSHWSPGGAEHLPDERELYRGAAVLLGRGSLVEDGVVHGLRIDQVDGRRPRRQRASRFDQHRHEVLGSSTVIVPSNLPGVTS